MFRRLKSLYCLSIPFIFYGLAFFFIGITPFVHSVSGRGWVQNVATALYATASSSGSIFFALNFGDEGQLSLIHPRFHILPSFPPIVFILTDIPIQVAPQSKPGFTEPASSRARNRSTLWHYGTGVRT